MTCYRLHMLRRIIKRLLLPPMVIAAAFIMFVEEWLWKRLANAMARLAQARVIRAIEAWLATLPPYGAAAAFIIPGLLLLPVKIAALFLIAHRHAVAGLSVIIAAKIVGTACAARLYSVCRPALLSLAWFRWLHHSIIRLKTLLYSAIKAMPGWATAVRWKAIIKARFARAGFFTQRWRAVVALLKKRIFRKTP